MSDQVERFEFHVGTVGRGAFVESEDGQWVRYSDYEKLQAQLAATRHKWDEESELAEAAEKKLDQARKERDEELRERLHKKAAVMGYAKTALDSIFEEADPTQQAVPDTPSEALREALEDIEAPELWDEDAGDETAEQVKERVRAHARQALDANPAPSVEVQQQDTSGGSDRG
jgi:hypothetical protein